MALFKDAKTRKKLVNFAKKGKQTVESVVLQQADKRAELDEKAKKERARAQKLAVKSIRSRRSASRYNESNTPSYGSPTIG